MSRAEKMSTPDTFLSDKEIAYLTGFKQAKRQIGWLQKHNIKHFVAGNSPRVPRGVIEPEIRKSILEKIKLPLEAWQPAALRSK